MRVYVFVWMDGQIGFAILLLRIECKQELRHTHTQAPHLKSIRSTFLPIHIRNRRFVACIVHAFPYPISQSPQPEYNLHQVMDAIICAGIVSTLVYTQNIICRLQIQSSFVEAVSNSIEIFSNKSVTMMISIRFRNSNISKSL